MSAVEFALLLPFLLLVLFAIVQFGMIFAVQSAIGRAAESASRTSAIEFGKLVIENDTKPAWEDARARGYDAVPEALSRWWPLFFADDTELSSIKEYAEIICKDVGTGGTTYAANTEITVQTTEVMLVDYIPIDDFYGTMKASSDWPTDRPCEE